MLLPFLGIFSISMIIILLLFVLGRHFATVNHERMNFFVYLSIFFYLLYIVRVQGRKYVFSNIACNINLFLFFLHFFQSRHCESSRKASFSSFCLFSLMFRAGIVKVQGSDFCLPLFATFHTFIFFVFSFPFLCSEQIL